jgi:hypothetical protein
MSHCHHIIYVDEMFTFIVHILVGMASVQVQHLLRRCVQGCQPGQDARARAVAL